MKILLYCMVLALGLGTLAVTAALGGFLGIRGLGRQAVQRIIPMAAVLVILALDAWGISTMIPREKEPVTIQACTTEAAAPEGARLYLIDVTADGIKRTKGAEASGHWILHERGYLLNAEGLPSENGALDTLNLRMPVGTDRCLLMACGPKELQMIVTVGDYSSFHDCYADLDGEVLIPIPNSDMAALKRLWRAELICYTILLILADGVFVLLCRRLRKMSRKGTTSFKRNGAVELYRFLFALIIILHHAQPMGGLKGYLSVEFFFIISGWFLMVHFDRQSARGTVSLKEYTLGRICRIYPYFLTMWLLSCLAEYGLKGSFMNIVGRNLGELLMVQCLGFGIHDALVGNDWFLSAMLLASMAIYVLLQKDRRRFTTWIAPLLAVMVFGYFALHFDNYDQTVWDAGPGGFLTRGLWRGMAEIGIGCCLYDWSKPVRERKHSAASRAWASVLELVLLSLIGVVIFTWREHEPDLLPLLLIVAFVGCVMSADSCLTRALNGRIAEYLGSLSMAMYLSHTLFLQLQYRLDPALPFVPRFLLGAGLSVVFSAITMPLVNRLTAWLTVGVRKLKNALWYDDPRS